MSPALLLYFASAWLLGSAVLRAWFQRKRTQARSLGPPRLHERAVMAQAVGSLLACAAIWPASTVFLQGQAIAAGQLLAASGAVATLIALASAFLFPDPPGHRKQMITGYGSLVFGASIYLSLLFIRSSPPGALKLDYPLRGEWRAITGGSTRLTNYHHGQPPEQNYAVDLVLHREPESSAGREVVAPCAGTIANVSSETETAEGNLIILECPDGTHVWLAHLKEHSILVTAGQQVRAGDRLAAVGSTGSAESPHLHIHAQRNNQPIPMRFGPGQRFLVRGDVFSSD